jgi:hypothetical protein
MNRAVLTNGDPELGVWCDGCLTTNAVRFDVLLISADGVENFGQIDCCDTCDEEGDD